MMKIAAVTGATGLVGSHLCEQLLSNGFTVIVLTRAKSNFRWIEQLPVTRVPITPSPAELAGRLQSVTHFFHVAGVTKAKRKQEYFDGNTTATKYFLDCAKQLPSLQRFVLVSSLAAVGPGEGDALVDENTPFHPITTYGISKSEAEKLALVSMKEIPITITRPPAVYGPRDTDIYSFFQSIQRGVQPIIGKKHLSLIHVRDLARGIMMAGLSEASAGKTYFLANPKSYDWNEVGSIAAHIMNKRPLSIRVPKWGVYFIGTIAEGLSVFSSKPALLNLEKTRDLVQDNWTCSAERAKQDFGFVSEISLETGFKETVDWYKANGWL